MLGFITLIKLFRKRTINCHDMTFQPMKIKRKSHISLDQELIKILEKYDANDLKTIAIILEIFERIGNKLKT